MREIVSFRKLLVTGWGMVGGSLSSSSLACLMAGVFLRSEFIF